MTFARRQKYAFSAIYSVLFSLRKVLLSVVKNDVVSNGMALRADHYAMEGQSINGLEGFVD